MVPLLPLLAQPQPSPPPSWFRHHRPWPLLCWQRVVVITRHWTSRSVHSSFFRIVPLRFCFFIFCPFAFWGRMCPSSYLRFSSVSSTISSSNAQVIIASSSPSLLPTLFASATRTTSSVSLTTPPPASSSPMLSRPVKPQHSSSCRLSSPSSPFLSFILLIA